MAERSSRSPGVRSNEIDKSGPRNTGGPAGVPAGIVGTAQAGPAFVPVTVSNFSEFEAKFGKISGDQFGPIAAKEWLTNARALTYVRVLGTGDGKQRSTSNGRVTNAGFVVGQRLPLATGYLGNNPNANATGDEGPAPLGRTYFLGAYMSASTDSGIFADANIQTRFRDAEYSGSVPILRGVLMTASGVLLNLSSSNNRATTSTLNEALPTDSSNAGLTRMGTHFTGSVSPSTQIFKMNVVGLNSEVPITRLNLTASFDPTADSYFGNVFNSDPEKIQDHGYVLYTHFPIRTAQAVVTGSGLVKGPLNHHDAIGEESIFLITGSQARNAGSSTAPNYENFNERFRAARTPFVVSQKFGGSSNRLFRFHLLTDGVLKGKTSDSQGSNAKYKITIKNIQKSSDPLNDYGRFDVEVRDFYDVDNKKIVYESYPAVTLDPKDDNYIARRIGDLHTFYDFDRAEGSQRLVVEGKYANVSNILRVEMDPAVDDGSAADVSLPLGFRGLDHLITSGSSTMADASSVGSIATLGNNVQISLTRALRSMVQPPVPFRENLRLGAAAPYNADRDLHWGVQFEVKESLTELNKSKASSDLVKNMTKFFPDFAVGSLNMMTGSNAGQADEAGTVLDCDEFNKNGFTLENVQVATGSDGFPTTAKAYLIHSWSYKRKGVTTDRDTKTRALEVNDLDSQRADVIGLAKFTFPFQQGFDGLSIFNRDTVEMNNAAAKQEMDDSNRGQLDGPTVAAYRKAVDIFGDKADTDIQLLAIPGIRVETVSDRAITKMEQRFDALYIMDIEERDGVNAVVTSSAQIPHVKNTAVAFSDRSLDSSFAAAYFPNLSMNVEVKSFNPETGNELVEQVTKEVPPSVGVLGAFALNDAIAFPWFAPAGDARGKVNANSTAISLNTANQDELNGRNINAIRSYPNSSGPVIFGQHTLQLAATALDRINVRRLLIDVRRSVKQVANTLIFEPNREATLQRFTSLVNPILQRVQENQGISRYKVIIDSSTTTQVDIENNTVRGKIFLQPTRTAEFISLDFVVTNSGVQGL